ncbi:MAG TPA: sugar phosphorylase [Victivallales bacterium]|nr:sugar phosphorylase [Victivallales bacterium]
MSFNIEIKKKNQIINKLKFLFPDKDILEIYYGIEAIIDKYSCLISDNNCDKWLDEKDIFLITYGDSINSKSQTPLKTLHDFLNKFLNNCVKYVHILPFYPYSSDDGFSVIDYFKVNKELGNWSDIENMSSDFKLMFDAVINHISAKSDWFQEYLSGNPVYKDYFLETQNTPELSKVTRPRALPLLTGFDTTQGEKLLWTTFSEDQIDLNYKNQDTFLKIIDLLLFYISKGAKSIRLDAIGFMWKEIGTNCIHLPQAHKTIQLFRDIFDIVAPETLIITETNVPHKDNISYFGNGYNEAQLVYQFPLPPLVLFSFISGSAEYLSKWADSLELTSDRTTFFNFLASHDGIGIVPTTGILSDKQRKVMVEHVKNNGGYVSNKTAPDGKEIPYELNINYFDAILDKNLSFDRNIDRFLASQSILLSIIGAPAIYIHSILGSQNYTEGVKETGRYRTVNREKLSVERLEEELFEPTSLRSKIIKRYKYLIKIRQAQKAFHPNAYQKVLFINDCIFSLHRQSPDGNENIFVFINVSSNKIEVDFYPSEYGVNSHLFNELISGTELTINDGKLSLCILPYQVMWISNI